MEMKNAVTKGAITFFYLQKAKDTKQKLKEKVYLMKRKIKKSTFEVKKNFIGNQTLIVLEIMYPLSWGSYC